MRVGRKRSESYSQNKELIKFLAERRTRGKRIPIEKVRVRFGSDPGVKE